LEFTSSDVNASEFFVAEAKELIDVEIETGSDFNPKSTTWQENDFAAYPNDVWTYDNSDLYDKFLKDVDANYQTQFGATSTEEGYATTALDEIETALIAQGDSLRYDKGTYLAFRNTLLSNTFACNDMYNGKYGERTVAYVYFTNATNDQGEYHPFMVIASHDASAGPNFLIDVARPPGDGLSGGYADQTITRNAVLEVKLVKIPLRDYGLITNLEDNDFTAYNGTLADDAGLSSGDYTVYNYASLSSSGIAANGVVIYPAYNNNLRFAAEDAEITNTGIHVGRGMGLHYHSDGHSYNGNGLNLYNEEDYTGKNHSPMIGFAFDGIALFGKYDSNHSSMTGYTDDLDEYGGHEHDDLGYHYHTFKTEYSIVDGPNTLGPFSQHFLLAGAWKGNINNIPGMLEVSTAQLKDATVGRYAGASYTSTTSSSEIDMQSVKTFPNPSDGTISIETNEVFIFEVFDMNGKKIMTDEINEYQTTLILNKLETGTYLIKIIGESGTSTQKIIIK
jgi:hypothetical protein